MYEFSSSIYESSRCPGEVFHLNRPSFDVPEHLCLNAIGIQEGGDFQQYSRAFAEPVSPPDGPYGSPSGLPIWSTLPVMKGAVIAFISVQS